MVALSICMPVYNVGRYLNQCLESISQQTFRDFEVIMVDNGSTDNSLRFVKNMYLEIVDLSYITKVILVLQQQEIHV